MKKFLLVTSLLSFLSQPFFGQEWAELMNQPNANFYDVAKQGSGDKFDSLTVGTPAAQNDDKKKKKKRTIQTFMDFSKAMKMLQEK